MIEVNRGGFWFYLLGLVNWILFAYGFADLYFAFFDESLCLDEEVLGIYVTLKIWLLIDGIVRMGLGCTFGLVFISYYSGIRRYTLAIIRILLFIYGIYLLYWVFIGSNLYWDHLSH